ncbi:hypothetical protein TNCV_211361 [Trichonephila clavipes]|uniref:Uncharacterized protein n=1 Tax=Trichonephila clavipes TaxID=2585209 RepID=A0A8X6SUZ2_TRICX|nr:hypothetical protein TNCV_211361 [Trichonephila clavipes]
MKIGVILTGASVYRTANLADISRTTFPRVIMAYTNLDYGRMLVWKTPAEGFSVDCLVPTVKHRGGSVMLSSAPFFHGLEPLVFLEKDDHRGPLMKHSRG